MNAPDHLEISLDQLLNIRDPGTYLVMCEGDSMRGAGVFSGDLLIVDKGREPQPGNMVIGVINQEPAVKFLNYVQGRPVLKSANRGFPDRHILEGDTFEVWGVVTYSVRDHSNGA